MTQLADKLFKGNAVALKFAAVDYAAVDQNVWFVACDPLTRLLFIAIF